MKAALTASHALLVTLAVFMAAQPAAAYGRMGHWLSGRIAESLLSAPAQRLVATVLGENARAGVTGDTETHDTENKGNWTLGRAALWADTVKKRAAYAWTGPLHYVNPAGDRPPAACSYRPGGGGACASSGCIVAAIRNYTARLVLPPPPRIDSDLETKIEVDKALPPQKEALLFLVHLVGDIHQPLHVSGRDRGGNDARVRFNGRSVSLHAVWDYLLFEKRISDDFGGSKERYAVFLLNQIASVWLKELPAWLACAPPATSASPAASPLCPEIWARQSNAANCEFVWNGYRRKYELSGRYYSERIGVAEKMLAQSAVRMAAVLGFAATILEKNVSLPFSAPSDAHSAQTWLPSLPVLVTSQAQSLDSLVPAQ